MVTVGAICRVCKLLSACVQFGDVTTNKKKAITLLD